MDISLPQYASNYDGYLLMKFTSCADFQNDFLDGKLFFNTSDYFSSCENKGQGDRNEGSTFVVNYNDPGLQSVTTEMIDGKLCLVINDYSNNPQDYRPSTVWDYSKAENRNRKIICFYTAFLNIKSRMISNFPSNMGDEFGKFGVLILDRHEFYSRVCKAFQESKAYSDVKMGFVDYQDMKSGINQWGPFRKEKKIYSYQNEFRISFISNDDKPVQLDLKKSLRDIAVPIYAEDVSKICFHNNNLIYPIYTDTQIEK